MALPSPQRAVASASALARAALRPERPDRLPRAAIALAAYGPTMAGAVAAATARYPLAPAVIDEQGRLSYADLWAATDGVARGLRARGVGPGQHRRCPRPQPPWVRRVRRRRRQARRRHRLPQHRLRCPAAGRRRRPRGHRRRAPRRRVRGHRRRVRRVDPADRQSELDALCRSSGRTCRCCRRDGRAARSSSRRARRAARRARHDRRRAASTRSPRCSRRSRSAPATPSSSPPRCSTPGVSPISVSASGSRRRPSCSRASIRRRRSPPSPSTTPAGSSSCP